MRTKGFLLIALLSLLVGCNRQAEVDENGRPLIIDLQTAINKPVKEMLLSDVAEDIEIVPLETTENSLFANVRNIMSFGEGFIVYNRQHGDKCVYFDRNGKVKHIFHYKGQGPEEVIYPCGAGYDERTKSLEIFGLFTNTLASYGLDGTFRKTVRVYKEYSPIYAEADVREERTYRNVDGYHVMRRMLPSGDPDNPWQILIRDSANRRIAVIADPIALKYKDMSVSEEPDKIIMTTSWNERSPVMTLYKGSRSILFDGNDTIYRLSLSQGRLYRRYLMKTGSDRVPIGQMHKADLSDNYLNKYIHPKDMLESKEYVFIVCENGANSYLVRFSKETGEMGSVFTEGKNERSAVMGVMRRRVKTPEFIDDLAGGCSFFPDHTNDNEWIGVISAERLLNELDINEQEKRKVKLPHRKQQLIEVLKNLKEDDNYILMVVKLK